LRWKTLKLSALFSIEGLISMRSIKV